METKLAASIKIFHEDVSKIETQQYQDEQYLKLQKLYEEALDSHMNHFMKVFAAPDTLFAGALGEPKVSQVVARFLLNDLTSGDNSLVKM